MAGALTNDVNVVVVRDLLKSGFSGLGSRAGGASWVRGSPVAPACVVQVPECPVVLCCDVTPRQRCTGPIESTTKCVPQRK